ncbi:MAG TPA: tellurite resistance protein permease, partial [Marmoricola sp.]
MADLSGRMHGALRSLSPGYFAMVMATGVVSVGLKTEGYATLSDVLLILATAGFAVLLVLNGWRFVSHRHELAWDFTHPLRGFGFYTFVAAGNVLAA